jgi:hypothetical protein
MSALPPKADIDRRLAQLCFVPTGNICRAIFFGECEQFSSTTGFSPLDTCEERVICFRASVDAHAP